MAVDKHLESVLTLSLNTQFHAALTVIEIDPAQDSADLLGYLGLLEPLTQARNLRIAQMSRVSARNRTAVLANPLLAGPLLAHLPSPRDPEQRSITEMASPSERTKAREIAAGVRVLSHRRSSGPQRTVR